MRKIFLAIFLIAGLGSSVAAQGGQVWIDPSPDYTSPEQYRSYTVKCFSDLVGIKAIHFDIDVDPAVVVAIEDSIRHGDMFVPNDTHTFFFTYTVVDSSRITADIAVLTDSATVSGPGNLLEFVLYTKALGESDISITNLDVRDRFNQPIATQILDGFIEVCYFVGDLDASGFIDIIDLTFWVNYSFQSGPAPTPLASADTTCDGSIDISDLTALVSYMFQNGTLCGPCIP